MSWTAEKVAERFEECVWVFNRLPNDRRLGFAHCWPEVVHTPRELRRQTPEPLRLRPLPEAIDRAEATLTWILWVDEPYRPLIWLRAHRVSWRGIARETGWPKTTAQRHWHNALKEIAGCLPKSRVVAGSCEHLRV